MTITIAISPNATSSPGTASVGPGVPVLLAIVAGFVDSCAFLAFNGFFIAQATGSFVLAGAGFWAPASFAIIKVAAIPVFMTTAAATAALIRSMKASQNCSLAVTLSLEALLIVGLMILGGMSATGPAVTWACLLGLAAMGVHSALCRLLLSDYGATSVMTTNTVQFSVDLADSLLKRSLEPRLIKTGSIMLAFLIGVGSGALSFSSIGFSCLLAPILVLTAIATRSFVNREDGNGR